VKIALDPADGMDSRCRFMFSNPSAQRAEARLNCADVIALTARWLPRHLAEPATETESRGAGACFRNVTAILRTNSK
jgi:hypothetical protein